MLCSMLSESDNELLTRVGPGTPMGELLRRFWLPVLMAEELPEPDCAPVKVRLLGEDLVAFRDTSGRLGLMAGRCAHRLAHLYYGRNEENGLRCAYHGWKFDVNGRCVDMPTAQPEEANFKDKVNLKAYTLREAAGILWAYMGPRDNVPDMPRLPLIEAKEGHRFAIKRYQESNYLQAIEGGIDSAHTRYLHTTLEFYNRSEAYLAAQRPLLERFKKDPNSLDPEELDAIFRTADKAPRVRATRTDYGLAVGARTSVEGMSYWRFNQFLLPFYTMPPRDPGGHAFVPIDDNSCWVFTFRVNTKRPFSATEVRDMRTGLTSGRFGAPVDENYFPLAHSGNDFTLDREIQRDYNFTGIIGTGNQDMAVQVSMGTIVDRTQEHLGIIDTGIIEMRKLLLDLVRDHMAGKDPLAATNPEVFAGVRGASLMRPNDVPYEDCVREVLELIDQTKDRLAELRQPVGA
jgi:phenylpropionate dioxygenase-like ring-hydroxylating dioxygenase large terminal subunit